MESSKDSAIKELGEDKKIWGLIGNCKHEHSAMATVYLTFLGLV